MKALSAALTLSLVAVSGSVHAQETRYVRDWISVPLHAAQAADSEVVHRGLASGSAVTLLENDDRSGQARVRTADGVEGWMPARYLSAEPAARTLLEKANAEIAELRQLNEQLKNQQPADQRQMTQRLEELQAANARLSGELEALKRAPGNAEQLEALRQRNAALHEQFNQFSAAFQQAQNKRDTDMFRNGALAVLAGALLTLLVPRLWPKKRSEWV